MGDQLEAAFRTQAHGADLFEGGPYGAFKTAGQRPFGNNVEGRLPGIPDTGYFNMTGMSNPFIGQLAQGGGRGMAPPPFPGDPAGLPMALPGAPGAPVGSSGPWGPVGGPGGGEGGGHRRAIHTKNRNRTMTVRYALPIYSP